MSIKLIRPNAKLPLSSATVHNGVVYVSGMVGFKPGTAELISDTDVSEQTRQTLANIDDVLKEAGTSRRNIIRCGVFLKHVEKDFAAMNKVYTEFMGDHRPARTTCAADLALPKILVEIDCIAALA